MLNMENAEEVMQILERFTRLKQKEIPKELDDYMHYVAKTGDTVFKWSSLKYLFREKLLNVIKNFHDTSPRVDDLPQYPNVDPFNYESMKSSLLERLELFNAAPFTVQRLCELLTEPRKQYSRIDKFMRALEKNILVSTIEPGRKRTESENGDSLDSVVNGDVSLDVNVDIDMENETIFNADTQSNATSSSTPSSQLSSNLIHKSDDDVLPNPKKPKLELDETNDVETEVATKSITNSKQEVIENCAENAIADKTIDLADNKKNEERMTEKSTVSIEKPAANTMVESQKDSKHSESEKIENSLAVESPDIDKIIEEPAKEIKEKEETITPASTEIIEVAKITPPTSSPEVIVAEKAEKIDGQLEGNKKDCTGEILEKQDTEKEIQGEKLIKEQSDRKENYNGNIEGSEHKTETTTNNYEKTNDKQCASEVNINSEEKQEVVKDEANEAIATSVAVVVKLLTDEVVTSKTEVGLSAVPETLPKPVEIKSADDAVTNTEVLLVNAEKVEEKCVEHSTETFEKHDAADQTLPTVAESLQKESPEISVENKATGSKKEEIDKSIKVSAVVNNDAPISVAVDKPTVTADHPMEENPESIAEVEPAVMPTIVVETAANVEEIVMGDSIEMATDPVEPVKDEPAGMEVDDTSQEAMDQ